MIPAKRSIAYHARYRDNATAFTGGCGAADTGGRRMGLWRWGPRRAMLTDKPEHSAREPSIYGWSRRPHRWESAVAQTHLGVLSLGW